MKPHKHAEIIKAWADGAEIEYHTSSSYSNWNPICLGWSWDNTLVAEYRIKPEPKPDVVSYTRAGGLTLGIFRLETDDLKLTFDGETGKLKAAEVIV